MKKGLSLVLIILLALVVAIPESVAASEPKDKGQESHRIENKWDLSGSFVALKGYNWGGLAEAATWHYQFHIKEAVDGSYSVGSIRFWTDTGIEVTGHVEVTARNYPYNQSWRGENLAVAGWADCADDRFNFILLYSTRAVWLAVSDLPYEPYWVAYSAWPPQLRRYQVHSLNSYDFPFIYKTIVKVSDPSETGQVSQQARRIP